MNRWLFHLGPSVPFSWARQIYGASWTWRLTIRTFSCDAAHDIVTTEVDELAIPCDSVKDGVVIVLVLPPISSDLVVGGILADSAIEVTGSWG